MLEGFLLKFLTSFFYNVKNTLHPPLLPLPSCRYTALCLLVSNYGLIAKGDSDASVWGMFSAADYYTFGARAGAVFILRLTRGAYFYGNEGTLHPVQRRRLINVLLIVEQWIFARMGISIVWLWLRREFQGPACFVGFSWNVMTILEIHLLHTAKIWFGTVAMAMSFPFFSFFESRLLVDGKRSRRGTC